MFCCARQGMVVSAICAGISLFIDIGMTNEVRYGIPTYFFIFGNEGRCGIIMALSLLVILYVEKRPQKILLYELLAAVSMIMTTKGIVYIIIAMYIGFQFLFRIIERRKKVNFKTIVPILVIVVLVANYQIQNYFLNIESARMLFIKYGFITALDYAPLGSGFATFGSHMAAIYYSPLYFKYGWQYRYALGIDYVYGGALNDNYLGGMLGQVGFIGFSILLYLFFQIFRQVNSITSSNNKQKAGILSLFLTMIAAATATGIIKSSIGVLTFAIIGTLKGYDIAKINSGSSENRLPVMKGLSG
jgi:hypothetical protein